MALYRRGSIWWCRWRIGGAEVRESAGTADRAQAQEYHDRRRADLWRAQRLGERRTDWDAAALAWIEEHAHAKRSYSDDLLLLRWLQPRLTGRDLATITPELLREIAAAKIAEGRAPSTANKHLATVSAVLRFAAKKGWLKSVPWVPYLPTEGERIAWITREQAEQLLAELPDHLAAMARFTLATGLRRANVTGLEWANVDLGRRVCWIWPDEAKAGKAIAVPLNDDAAAVLQGQLGEHERWVFTWRGAPVYHTKTKAWDAAVARAGIAPGFRWHDLRHTWATWHVMAGTPLEVLMKLGGWSSMAMVLRYAHFAPGYLAEYAYNIQSKRESPNERESVHSREGVLAEGKSRRETDQDFHAIEMPGGRGGVPGQVLDGVPRPGAGFRREDRHGEPQADVDELEVASEARRDRKFADDGAARDTGGTVRRAMRSERTSVQRSEGSGNEDGAVCREPGSQELRRGLQPGELPPGVLCGQHGDEHLGRGAAGDHREGGCEGEARTGDCERTNRAHEMDTQGGIKKKGRLIKEFGVADGIRTHDNRNHKAIAGPKASNVLKLHQALTAELRGKSRAGKA